MRPVRSISWPPGVMRTMEPLKSSAPADGVGAHGREGTLWLVALFVSLMLHGLFFLWQPIADPARPVEKQKLKVTRLSFRQTPEPRPRPVPVVPAVPVIVPEPKTVSPPELQVAKPKPAVRPKTTRIAKTKSVMPQVKAELPAPAAPATPAPPVAVAATPIAQEVKSASPPPPSVDPAKRRQFFELLFNRIEAHKHYPATARRRRLEGGVDVSFTLGSDGSVNGLRVSDGHPLLQEAARRSVERSLPLPVPGEGLSLPLAVEFRMEFRLR